MPEIGYGGSVGEANWSTLAPSLGVEYTVDGYGDWLATPVPLSDRTLSLAAGTGTGKGIADTTTAPVSVTLDPVDSGFRWDLICRHRDTAGSGGTSSFVVIEGTPDPLAVFGSRDLFGPTSTEDDQPLWLARVDNGSTNITDLKDVRVWQGNNGAVAKAGQGDYPLQYLTKLGSTVQIGDTLHVRTFAADGLTVAWKKYALQPTATSRAWGAYRTTVAPWVGRAAMAPNLTIPEAPAGDYTITASASIRSTSANTSAGAKRITVNGAEVGLAEQDDIPGSGLGWVAKQHHVIYRHTGGPMVVAYLMDSVGAHVQSASVLVAYTGPVG